MPRHPRPTALAAPRLTHQIQKGRRDHAAPDDWRRRVAHVDHHQRVRMMRRHVSIRAAHGDGYSVIQKGRRGDAAHDRPGAHDGCGVRELSPMMLAAWEGSSELRQRRSRWRRWQGDWCRRIWLNCVHPGPVVAHYSAFQDHEARGKARGARRWRRTRAARDRASGPRDGIGSASGGLC